MNELYGRMHGWMGAWVAECKQGSMACRYVEVKVEVPRHRRMHVCAYM